MIYHGSIYSTNIYQVSAVYQALVRTLRCNSQQDPSISIRTILHLRLYDFIGMSSFLFNLLYIVARASIFSKYKSKFEKCVQ